ncbi:60S ribosomal protein L7A [Cichlidogyrus casuarinus]|uniref:60S ribosomal protein L7a n=1 Tax=Cichlidogyrus casuarinus TaxID=1844966 RepID=A0ABD2QLS5_9PLAT
MPKGKKVVTAKNVGKVEVEAPTAGTGRSKVAAAPSIASKGTASSHHGKDKLIVARPRDFGIGRDIQPKRDLHRFVKWPKYIIRQRKRAILKKRLKVPPPINQFTQTLDRSTSRDLFKLLGKYRPTPKHARKVLLKIRAKNKAEGKKDEPKAKKIMVKHGIREVTQAVMKKKAKLVVIAHDVEPVEIVLFLPALCRKMGVPYAIVKAKSVLGRVVRRKTCTCLAFTQFNNADSAASAKLIETINNNYNLRFEEIRKHWGGGVMGQKSMHRVAKLEKAKAKEVGIRT